MYQRMDMFSLKPIQVNMERFLHEITSHFESGLLLDSWYLVLYLA